MKGGLIMTVQTTNELTLKLPVTIVKRIGENFKTHEALILGKKFSAYGSDRSSNQVVIEGRVSFEDVAIELQHERITLEYIEDSDDPKLEMFR